MADLWHVLKLCSRCKARLKYETLIDGCTAHRSVLFAMYVSRQSFDAIGHMDIALQVA